MKTLGQILGMSNRSIFEDAMPELREGESRDFAIEDHHMRVTATNELGCDTGRRRYRVECLSCGEVVHAATTGPQWNMKHHLRDAADGRSEQAAARVLKEPKS
jgi:hypothetical protein